mgnify:CR=1 FL=1
MSAYAGSTLGRRLTRSWMRITGVAAELYVLARYTLSICFAYAGLAIKDRATHLATVDVDVATSYGQHMRHICYRIPTPGCSNPTKQNRRWEQLCIVSICCVHAQDIRTRVHSSSHYVGSAYTQNIRRIHHTLPGTGNPTFIRVVDWTCICSVYENVTAPLRWAYAHHGGSHRSKG